MQETWVHSLVREDPTGRRLRPRPATREVTALRSPGTATREQPPLVATGAGPQAAAKISSTQSQGENKYIAPNSKARGADGIMNVKQRRTKSDQVPLTAPGCKRWNSTREREDRSRTGWEMDLKRAAWEQVAAGHSLLERRRVERKHPGLCQKASKTICIGSHWSKKE